MGCKSIKQAAIEANVSIEEETIARVIHVISNCMKYCHYLYNGKCIRTNKCLRRDVEGFKDLDSIIY